MAVVAVALGVTTEMLVAVRPVEPVEAPIPVVDDVSAARIASDEVAATKRVESSPPPAEIRAIGSAFLAWNEAGAVATSPGAKTTVAEHDALQNEIRTAIGVARKALGEDETKRQLADLRSDHTERFLCTLRRASKMGVDDFCRSLLSGHAEKDDAAELRRLGGVLPELLARNGWIDATGAPHVPEPVLRARYSLFWTSTVYGLDDCDHGAAPECYGVTSLPLPVDEVRVLLAFLVAHPVVRAEDMALSDDDVVVAADRRRLVYVDRLAALDAWADPTGKTHPYTRGYDVDLARGAMLYRLGKYADAERALRLATERNRADFRARNWLLATLDKLSG